MLSLCQSTGFIYFCRRKSRNLENLAAADIVLTAQDMKEVNEIIATHSVKGDRYFGNDEAAGIWR